MREKSDLEKQLRSKKYWKDKAEKLQKENIILKEKLKYAELALNIWSNWQSEFILWKNYEQQFENWMPKYKSDLFK